MADRAPVNAPTRRAFGLEFAPRSTMCGGSAPSIGQAMELLHFTTDEGKLGIEAQGFARSLSADSEGCSWLSPSRDAKAWGRGDDWLVIVEMPAEVAEEYVYRFPEDGAPFRDSFLIPFDVLNAHQPFRFERP